MSVIRVCVFAEVFSDSREPTDDVCLSVGEFSLIDRRSNEDVGRMKRSVLNSIKSVATRRAAEFCRNARGVDRFNKLCVYKSERLQERLCVGNQMLEDDPETDHSLFGFVAPRYSVFVLLS